MPCHNHQHEGRRCIAGSGLGIGNPIACRMAGTQLLVDQLELGEEGKPNVKSQSVKANDWSIQSQGINKDSLTLFVGFGHQILPFFRFAW